MRKKGVVDDMMVARDRLFRARMGSMQDHVGRQIGIDSDLAAQMVTMRLQPSPPHSRDSPTVTHNYNHRKDLE